MGLTAPRAIHGGQSQPDTASGQGREGASAMSFRWLMFASRNASGRGGAARMAADEDPASVDAAIARVLNAEALARADSAVAASEAEAILDEARRSASAVATRAERRIAAASRGYRSLKDGTVEEIHAQAAALDAEHLLDAEDRDEVDAAVSAAAADLTGGA